MKYIQTLLILAAVSINILAQTSYLDGNTPKPIQPGAPAGSYTLTDFEHIGPYNGSLSMRLPLLTIGGRGTTRTVMGALISQPSWTVDQSLIPINCGYGNCFTWLSQATKDWWNNGGPGTFKPGYGPGILEGKRTGRSLYQCPNGGPQAFSQTFTQLVFTAADGTEFQLYDSIGDGVYEVDSGCTNLTTYNRGRVFVTQDGSSATFISDIDPVYNPTGNIYDYYASDLYTNLYDHFYPTGDLMLKDGTKYRIVNGLVQWIRDSNGNKISFTYDATYYGKLLEAKDSLNRKVTVSYGNPDVITFKGFSGFNSGTRTLKIYWSTLSAALRPGSGYSIQTTLQLFPQMDTGSTYNPGVVSSIELPDSRRYYFYYNPYGEVAKVVLPTGGAILYEHGAGIRDGNSSGQIGKSTYWVYYSDPPPSQPNIKIYRRLLERRVLPDGTTLEKKTVYGRPERQVSESYSGVTFASDGYSQVDDFPSESAPTPDARSRHYFHSSGYGGAAEKLFYHNVMEGYPDQVEGKEFKTELLDNTTVVQKVENVWSGPVITETKTTWLSTNQVSKQTFSYDAYYNRQDMYEYDYGTGTPPTYATRHTHTDYLTTNSVNGTSYDTNTSIHIRNLPRQQIVYAVNPANGAETWGAQTVYEYDKYTGTNHAALVNRGSISGLDSAFTTSYQTRGNATQIDRWRNSSGTLLVSNYSQYDIAGNIVKTIDGQTPTGNATIFEFDDRYGTPNGEAQANSTPSELSSVSQTSFAFPTKVTNALNQISYIQFDYYLGKPVDTQDTNGIVSSLYYNDALDRPTNGVRASSLADTSAAKTQTAISYDDNTRLIAIISSKDSFTADALKTEVKYDGLGRTVEQRTYESATAYITVKTVYDALGRVYQVSNPYRSGDTILWTTNTYDALSRMTKVTTPDGAHVDTAYSGNRALVTDQARSAQLVDGVTGSTGGAQRVSQTNALGQLTDVWEVRSSDSATESVTFPGHSEVAYGYRSKYVYDALDDLITVTQQIGTGGTTQTRSFGYDPLKRLTSATNPENGATSYGYDNNGNLTSKTDARSITATINYDALNRPTSKTYSDSTPPVNYYYDNQTLPSGAPSYTRGSSIGRSGGGDLWRWEQHGRLLRLRRSRAHHAQVSADWDDELPNPGGLQPGECDDE